MEGVWEDQGVKCLMEVWQFLWSINLLLYQVLPVPGTVHHVHGYGAEVTMDRPGTDLFRGEKSRVLAAIH